MSRIAALTMTDTAASPIVTAEPTTTAGPADETTARPDGPATARRTREAARQTREQDRETARQDRDAARQAGEATEHTDGRSRRGTRGRIQAVAVEMFTEHGYEKPRCARSPRRSG